MQSASRRRPGPESRRVQEAAEAVRCLRQHVEGFDGRVLGLLEIFDSGLLRPEEFVLLLREWALEESVNQVVIKECQDILDLWGQKPGFVRERWPGAVRDGSVTLQSAIRFHGPSVLRRYAGGKCGLCKGSASACAPRHAVGRSCD